MNNGIRSLCESTIKRLYSSDFNVANLHNGFFKEDLETVLINDLLNFEFSNLPHFTCILDAAQK